MARSTTIAAPPPLTESLRIAIEDDASPVVRLVGRTLRDADRLGPGGDLMQRRGVVTVRSHDTPQVATVAISQAGVAVAGRMPSRSDATLVVDLGARFAPTEAAVGDDDLAAAVLRSLRPPVPHWRDAAARFWDLTRDIPGMPDGLVVNATSPDGAERISVGDGTASYVLSGPADLLAGVLSGADDFLAALATGLRVQGTLSQLSVMTAASWKVRFDV